jgi:hypothetical protein
MSSKNRRGGSHRSSVRDPSMHLEPQDLLYTGVDSIPFGNDYFCSVLGGRLEENSRRQCRGDCVRRPRPESRLVKSMGERTQLPSIAVTAPFCPMSSSSPSPRPALTPMSSNVSGAVESLAQRSVDVLPCVVGDASGLTVSLRLRSSFVRSLVNRELGRCDRL